MVRNKIYKGFIYIVEAEPNICKIGVTTQELDKRVYQLNCRHYRDFVIKGCSYSNDIYSEEYQVHEYLKDYRMKGEWFNLSYEEIKSRLREINFHFDDYDHFLLVERLINKAYWHIDPISKRFITREQAGYDENGMKIRR